MNVNVNKLKLMARIRSEISINYIYELGEILLRNILFFFCLHRLGQRVIPARQAKLVRMFNVNVTMPHNNFSLFLKDEDGVTDTSKSSKVLAASFCFQTRDS